MPSVAWFRSCQCLAVSSLSGTGFNFILSRLQIIPPRRFLVLSEFSIQGASSKTDCNNTSPLSLKHVIDNKVYPMTHVVNAEELAGAILRVLHIQCLSNVPVESHLAPSLLKHGILRISRTLLLTSVVTAFNSFSLAPLSTLMSPMKSDSPATLM